MHLGIPINLHLYKKKKFPTFLNAKQTSFIALCPEGIIIKNLIMFNKAECIFFFLLKNAIKATFINILSLRDILQQHSAMFHKNFKSDCSFVSRWKKYSRIFLRSWFWYKIWKLFQKKNNSPVFIPKTFLFV